MPDAALLLWEVGTEEMPAWACDQVLAQLPDLLMGELVGARLAPGDDLYVVAGPRRFAARVSVRTEQQAFTEESRGPAVRAAFDADGNATKACEGFARSKGLTPDQLERRVEEQGEFVYAVRELPAASFAEVFPAIAERVVGKLNFTKPMKWADRQERFIRPIRWIVTKLDDATIEYELWGVRSGDVTRTHRFLGEHREVVVPSSHRWSGLLAEHFVQVDQNERRALIVAGLDDLAASAGGGWDDPGGVLREVVHLVEHPSVLAGHFDERYLELPERVLVTAMQSHQRYLPVQRGEGGGLAPRFLTVMNGDPAAVGTILPGYERVLAGRLDDAVFSFDRDRARGLEDMASEASLGAVVFHAKAGSLAQRRDRIRAVAVTVANEVGADAEATKRAAHLAKGDQVSTVVQEFAELEGFVGSLYAADAGEAADVAAAIDQQFLPRSADGQLPDAGVPAIIALADKVELLVTMFGIGELPTGSRDPHGLRRAAIGVSRIVLEHDLPLDLEPALEAAAGALLAQQLAPVGASLVPTVRAFIDDRVEKQLTDDGVRIDAVRAARGANLPRLQHLAGLARALDAALATGDAEVLAVLTAVRRCAQILKKAGDDAAAASVEPALLVEPGEQALHASLPQVQSKVRDAVLARDFTGAVAAAATLAPAVDAFFDRDAGVMVMADEPNLRANRLALVREVGSALAPLGALHELQVG